MGKQTKQPHPILTEMDRYSAARRIRPMRKSTLCKGCGLSAEHLLRYTSGDIIQPMPDYFINRVAYVLHTDANQLKKEVRQWENR